MEGAVEYVNLLPSNIRKKKPLPAIPVTGKGVDKNDGQSNDRKDQIREGDGHHFDQNSDHLVDENNVHRVGQSSPLLVDEGIALQAGEGNALLVGQSKDLLVGESKDLLVGQSKDLLIGESKDLLVGQSKDLVGESKDLLVGQSKDLVGESKDLLVGQSKDLLVCESKDLLVGGSNDQTVMPKSKPRPMGSLPRGHLLDLAEMRQKLPGTCFVLYVVLVSLAAFTLTGFVVYREGFAGHKASQVVITCASAKIQHTATNHPTCVDFEKCQKLMLSDSCKTVLGAASVLNDSIRIHTEGKYFVQSVLIFANSSIQDCSKHKYVNINLVSIPNNETKISLAHKPDCTSEEGVMVASGDVQLEANYIIFVAHTGNDISATSRLVLYLEMILLKEGS